MNRVERLETYLVKAFQELQAIKETDLIVVDGGGVFHPIDKINEVPKLFLIEAPEAINDSEK